MLVLTRRIGESIQIGHNVVVTSPKSQEATPPDSPSGLR